MRGARSGPDGLARWVEVCYCPTPLQEERPYWEEYFELTLNSGRACEICDCTAQLEWLWQAIGEKPLPVVAAR